MRLLGLSLSFCIADLCRSHVHISEVDHIITGCNPASDEDFNRLITSYRDLYWKEFATRAETLARDLNQQRKISWLSVWRKSPPSIGQGYWIDLDKGMIPDHIIRARTIKPEDFPNPPAA